MPLQEGQLPLAHGAKAANYLQLKIRETVITNHFGSISFEGLPEGSNPANVVRCIKLLEHAASCDSEPDKCPEGKGCQRTRQVLAHHFGCKNKKRIVECSICCQLLALCRNHSDHCQATGGNCAVPYCKMKLQVPNPNKIRPNLQAGGGSRKEYQYVLKKLSEAMNLPTKQQKLQGIERLLVTNRWTTLRVLQHVLAKKQKSQPVSLCHQMNNLKIRTAIKPVLEFSHKKY